MATSSARKRKLSALEELCDGDFRYTKKSRRQMLQEAQAKDEKNNTRKKRRSSFMRGRREKHELLPNERTPKQDKKSEELYKQIPSEWISENRLKKLLELSLNMMIENINESSELNDSDLQTEVQGIIEGLRKNVDKNDFIKQACLPPTTEKKKLPNPTNHKVDDSLSKLLPIIQSLKKEGEEWEKLLKVYQEQAELSKNRLTSVNNNSNNNITCSLSSYEESLSLEKKEFLKGRLDMRSKTQNLREGWKEAICHIDTVFIKVQQMKSSVEIVREFTEQQTQLFGKKSYQELTKETPRHLIRGIVDD